MAERTSTNEFTEITERIVAFLKEALENANPERDVPASETLCRELLDVLDQSAAWDAGDNGAGTSRWESAIETVGLGIAKAFEDPSKWARIAKLTALYLRSAQTDDHPRAEKSIHQRSPNGTLFHLVRLDVVGAVIRAILSRSSQESRVTFYRSIDEWDVWRALGEALYLIVPDREELADALNAANAFAKNDILRGQLIEPLLGWASKNPSTARQIVDGWILGEPEFRAMDKEVIRLLVEAVVGASTSEEILPWKDGIVDMLSRQNDEFSWKLAAVIACFAWPKQPSPLVARRHAALLQQVERFPGRLVGVGLLAMTRDAREHPADTLATTMRLLELAGLDGRSEHALVTAEIAAWTMHSSRESGLDYDLVAPLQSTLLDVAPEQARTGLGLDSFLADLAKQSLSNAHAFVIVWLERHAGRIRQAHLSFADIFPLLTHELGPARQASWMVSFMVSSSATLRSVGTQFFVHAPAQNPTDTAFSKLDERQARSVCHLLAGTGAPGGKWIPSVLKLVVAYPVITDTVRAILHEAALNFPGSCGEAIGQWNVVGLPQAMPAELLQLRLDIENQLASLERDHRTKCAIPDLVAMRPATDEWVRVQQRLLDVSMREAQRKSLFSQIATRVPIARGGQTLMHPFQNVPTELKAVSGSIELPIVDSFDQLSGHLARLQHLRTAAMILEQNGNEGDPS